MNSLSTTSGILLILGYFAAMLAVVLAMRKGYGSKYDKFEYFVAKRRAPWLLTAFSMAATWVWAPSLFTASEMAYTKGFAGVFWFVVPNVLTLMLFAIFARNFRKKWPYGWTFSDYIREKYSKRSHTMFLVESFGLQVCSFAVQLLAGATIFHKITGMSFLVTTVLLAAIPLMYTFFSGIRGSITTDFIKMGFIVTVLLLGLPIISSNIGWDTLTAGLGGISGEYSRLFSGKGIDVMLSFGIPTTIGLLSGTFGDQMFWQRTFSVKKQHVGKTMFTAALIFGIVPISLSLFGFFAAGSGLEVADTQLVNVSTVIAYTPKWFLYLFFVLILAGLMSTVDSILCAVSSVAGHDVMIRIRQEHPNMVRNMGDVQFGRLAMVVVALLAILIANIPGLTITYLFLFYGTLRSSVMLPTIFAIQGRKMTERGLFWGIVVSLAVGLPTFAIGKLCSSTAWTLAGSLFTILASGIISRILPNQEKPCLHSGKNQ